LLGNPYPSAIDWENAGWTKVNVDDGIYITDNENGQFAGWLNGIGVNGGTGRVASGQAFWVKANGANPQVAVSEDVKSSQNDTDFFRTNNAEDNVIRLTLSNGSLSDEIAISLNPNAAEEYVSGEDLVKFTGNAPLPGNVSRPFEFASISSDYMRLAINATSKNECSIRIPLNMRYVQEGSYAINLGGLETLSQDLQVVLFDKFTEESVVLDETGVYEFEVNGESGSMAEDRFALELNSERISPFIAYADGVLRTNYENATWFLNDVQIEGAGGKEFVPKVSGQYRVQVASGTCVSESAPVDVVIGDEFADFFSLSPNPVVNTLNLRVYKGDWENIQVSIIDLQGRQFKEETIPSHTELYQIDVGDLPAGVYIVKLASGENTYTQRIIKR